MTNIKCIEGFFFLLFLAHPLKTLQIDKIPFPLFSNCQMTLSLWDSHLLWVALEVLSVFALLPGFLTACLSRSNLATVTVKFLTGMHTFIITYCPSLSADQKSPHTQKNRIKCSILHFHPDPLSLMPGLSGHHGSLYKFLLRTQHTLCFSLSHRTLISSLNSLQFLCTYLLHLEENNSEQLSMIIKDFNELCSHFLTSGWFIFRLSNLLPDS